jgi:hypothetical protein
MGGSAMTTNTGRGGIVPGRYRAAAVVAVALMLSGLGLTGCGVVKAVQKVKDAVESNKSTIDAFTNNLKSGKATPFEATYVTTGSSPTTVVYAVMPPKGLAFKETPAGGGSSSTGISRLDIVANASGEYSCTPPSGSGSGWSCQKLGAVNTATRNKILDFYTPSHWITFLRDFSLAAGFAGDKVTTSSKTVNGFSMHCVDFRAAGVAGTSRICSTAQGILGYVKVASNATSFEIKSYSTSPPASLFELPPGAKVTTSQAGNP